MSKVTLFFRLAILTKLLVKGWTQAKSSEICFEDLKLLESFFRNGSERETWTLQFRDSSGKPPTGILVGNDLWFGNKSQCSEATSPKRKFSGLLCVASYSVLLATKKEKTIWQEVCLPDTCRSIQKLDHLPDFYLHKRESSFVFTYKGTVVSVSCPEKVQDSFGYKSLLNFAVVLLLIVSFATGLDILDRQFNDTTKVHGSNKIWIILMCFSALKNTSAMFSTHKNPNELRLLHAIRGVGITAIFVAHFVTQTQICVFNAFFHTKFEERAFVRHINFSAMETFFFLSGLLVYRNPVFRSEHLKSILLIKFVLYRYLKMTPLLVLMIWVNVVGLWNDIGSPLMSVKLSVDFSENCSKHWWKNLLYINNFWGHEDQCLLVAWYIAVDMQLYILAPVFVMGLKKSTRLGLKLILAASLFCWILTGIQTHELYSEDLRRFGKGPTPTLSFWDKYVNRIYFMPHAHVPSHLIGILLGHLLKHFDVKTISISTINVISFALLNFTFITILVEFFNLSPFTWAFYVSFSRLIWNVFTAWMIIVSLSEKWPLWKGFLEWGFWLPLNRVLFVFYLTHWFLLHKIAMSSPQLLDMTSLNGWIVLLGAYFFCYLASCFLTIFFVAPVARLSNLLFSRLFKRGTKKETTKL